MEYMVVIAVGGLFLIVVIGRELILARKKRKEFTRSLYEDFGKLPQKEYSLDRFSRINSYFKRHKEEGQIDDITWNDLNMDRIFMMMNKTFSASGEEYLYYKLRTPVKKKEEMTHYESLVDYFQKNAKERVKIQELMSRLGHTGNYSLYDYIENMSILGERSNAKHILSDLLYLVGIGFLFADISLGLLFLAVLMVANIVSYFSERGQIEPFMVSFAYISRLLESSKELKAMNLEVIGEESRIFDENNRKIGNLNKSAWFVFSGARMGTSSNPIDLIMDYLKMIFHLDLIIFNRMLHSVNEHYREIDEVIGAVGAIESAIAVGNWRDYLGQKWCRPEIGMDKMMIFDKIYHPVLTDPVDNSLEVQEKRGVLITGSNASGKSTFLRTIALNFLFAQTINTCTAEKFHTPLVRLFSSMSLKDDLLSGESYYMAEIRSMKRILDEAKKEGNHLVCFVDEVLRGTNTVERIAASSEILMSLSGENITCFAATHDIELTALLKDVYDNYHFEEQIVDGDVLFSYRIFQGKANSSNAIRLLEIMGYDEEIIRRAEERAAVFLKKGVWEN